MTKPNLRKPSNVVVNTLLFNSILLLLTVVPLTLLEMCNENIAKNYTVVSAQKYITLSHIWSGLASVTQSHILA